MKDENELERQFSTLNQFLYDTRVICNWLRNFCDSKLGEPQPNLSYESGVAIVRGCASRLNFFFKQSDIRVILKRYGDGTWLEMMTRLSLRLDEFLKLAPEVLKRDDLVGYLEPKYNDTRYAHKYFSLVRENLRDCLPEEIQNEFRISLNNNSGDVQIGNKVYKLDAKSGEYYWFRHLFESVDFTTFPEALVKYPQLEGENVSRLTQKIQKSIFDDVIEKADKKTKGCRINETYQRVKQP